jgi:hypothetical protein
MLENYRRDACNGASWRSMIIFPAVGAMEFVRRRSLLQWDYERAILFRDTSRRDGALGKLLSERVRLEFHQGRRSSDRVLANRNRRATRRSLEAPCPGPAARNQNKRIHLIDGSEELRRNGPEDSGSRRQNRDDKIRGTRLLLARIFPRYRRQRFRHFPGRRIREINPSRVR